MAHEIPYVATATIADLHDLEAKVERAMELRGARYLHVLVTCPLGWGTRACDSVSIARLAVESGLFPVFEAEHGERDGRHADPPPRAGRGVPAAAAPLRPSLRARASGATCIDRIQARADRNDRPLRAAPAEEAP